MNILLDSILLGTGATAMTDLWGLARRPLLGVAAPDYAMVGRWIGHMGRGKFRHVSIARAAPIRAECAVGWLFHYATGIVFAGLLLLLVGPGWLAHPTPVPALAVGLGTVAAPFLVMQPALGAGIAARLTPRPGAARLQSLLLHAAFGIGLYLSGLVAAQMLA